MLQPKSVEVLDYSEMAQAISDITATVGKERELNAYFYFPHEHRWWEYASALTALEEWAQVTSTLPGPVRMLDAGVGHSVLSPAILSKHPYAEISEIELDSKIVEARNEIKLSLICHQESILDPVHKRYDAVFCISVIEHIWDWRIALKKLMDRVYSKGLLVITTDYGDKEKTNWINDSERENKFVEEDLREMAEILEDGGFKFEKPDYTFHGPQVFDYTFFRFIAVKK